MLSDPNTGKAYQIEPDESQFSKLIGKEIGEQIEGDNIGLSGYQLEIKGGSDEEGFPMRADVKGEGRTKPLLSNGSGYTPTKKGERRRKTVRGNKISKNIAQLNLTVKEEGEKSIEKILGLETEESEEEQAEEEEEMKEEKEEDEEEKEEESVEEEETDQEQEKTAKESEEPEEDEEEG